MGPLMLGLEKLFYHQSIKVISCKNKRKRRGRRPTPAYVAAEGTRDGRRGKGRKEKGAGGHCGS